MINQRIALTSASLFLIITCSSCGIPRYDVPRNSDGEPTLKTVLSRVECEMRDMVRDDKKQDVKTYHRLFLLNGDYDVAIAINIEENDSGGVSPNITYTNPISKVSSFILNGTAILSESRDNTSTYNVQLSFRDIFLKWKQNNNLFECPVADTNLARPLGIERLVAMADMTANLDTSITLASKGVFGGTAQFVDTKNLSALTPTWTNARLKGPGGVNLSAINTDKLTLAFAQGPNAGKPMALVKGPTPPNAHAQSYLNYLLTDSLDSKLTTLVNNSH